MQLKHNHYLSLKNNTETEVLTGFSLVSDLTSDLSGEKMSMHTTVMLSRSKMSG